MSTTYLRTWALDDIQISRAHADGRTVTAYAAIFDAPYEVVDQHGHYMEVIDRAAFNRTLSHGLGRTVCLYNHGMDLRGKPDAVASVPLGTPLEITPDGRGLLTVTRYNRSALADAALEAIRAGDIRSQSFRGRIFRSSPERVPRVKPGQGLPTVTRHELGLADYGPTPIPVNTEEMVVAVRSLTELVEDFAGLDADQRADLVRMLTATPVQDPAEPATSAQSEPGAEDSPADAAHSGRLAIARARMRMELTRRGIRHG
jgi:phage head maturation protease